MKQHFISLLLYLLLLPLAYATTSNSNSTYTEKNRNIFVSTQNPVFTLQLKSNPTTGYSWFLKQYDPKLITPLSHTFQRQTQMIGAPGYEEWHFRLNKAAFNTPQQTIVQMIYVRPWEKNQPPARVLQFIVNISSNTQK